MGWFCDRVIEAGGVAYCGFRLSDATDPKGVRRGIHRLGRSNRRESFRGYKSAVRPARQISSLCYVGRRRETWAARIVSILETCRHPAPIESERFRQTDSRRRRFLLAHGENSGGRRRRFSIPSDSVALIVFDKTICRLCAHSSSRFEPLRRRRSLIRLRGGSVAIDR
jgi:hypothetical protein